MTQNFHVCAIFFRPEEAYDVISGRNIKTIEGYNAIHFDVPSSNTFRDTKNKSFRDGGGGEAAAAEADSDDSIKR